MAQRSHVPKFGNWDGVNVPYTAYFENARKEKAGGVRMNPNDPEENPEAFMFGGFSGIDDSPHSHPANSVETNLDKLTVGGKYQNEGHKQHRGHQRNASDQHKSISKSMTASESGSEKSNSARSTPQQHNHHHHKRSDGPKSSESSNGFTRLKGGRNPSDDLSSRSASVPKFGAWDERDPKSGEGFTVIFNKVKEEKQIAAAKLPPVQPDMSNKKETLGNEPRQKKMFCCLF